MPLVIQAIQRYGWRDALSDYVVLEGIVHTSETLSWVLDELNQRTDGDEFASELSLLVSQADPNLLSRYRAQIESTRGLDAEGRRVARDRIRLLSKRAEACWQELENLCEQEKDQDYFSSVRLDEAYCLIEAIAGRGPEELGDRVMKALEQTGSDNDNGAMLWMEVFAVRLAGGLRLVDTVPRILDKLREDDEWLDEECMWALTKMGTDEVVTAVASLFPPELPHIPSYAAGVLGRIHTDVSIQTCLDLFHQADDFDHKVLLGQSLLSNFAEAGVGPVRQLILDAPPTRDVVELRKYLVITCTLLETELPELEEWETERDRDEAFSRQWQTPEFQVTQSLPEPTVSERRRDKRIPFPSHLLRERIGRNDPCPCGSGKKYKRCCMNKEVSS